MSQIAIAQCSPVFLNKSATIQKAVSLVNEVTSNNASLVIFPEAFVSGYPSWIWRLRPGGDWDDSEKLHSMLLDSAISIESDDLQPLFDTAKKNNVTIVCGIHDKDSQLSKSTLYNSVVVIGPNGKLINRHRKLMPTNPERMVWGFGDASGLNVVDTPCGRIGALICWENYMPLARYALYAQGIEIYIAPTYDSGDGWIGSLQHIAREGCCWVVGCGNAFKGSDFPSNMPGKMELYPDPDEWVNGGDSVVISPGGNIVAGPMRNEQGILYAEIDTKSVALARRTMDVVGHYSRPDIFTLHVNRQLQSPVKFE